MIRELREILARELTISGRDLYGWFLFMGVIGLAVGVWLGALLVEL